ncbi:hypothetical protein SAMD00019534_091810, partial [Acytostelium subglobosum LB1]|uniref:hypothetical protein n=1 Tax=Acytostelium subglobosum LB1 TaxID=1410327 RepID=UPI000644AD98
MPCHQGREESATYRIFSDLHVHCRSEHNCAWTYATCPNDRLYRKRAHIAQPDDTASIEMMLANGLIKCWHTSCMYFMSTEDTRYSHLSNVDHQCTDHETCYGCLIRANRRMGPGHSTSRDDTDCEMEEPDNDGENNDNDEDDEDDNDGSNNMRVKPRLQCLHDNCTVRHYRVLHLRTHCTTSHGCTHTYASCPNERKRRNSFFETPPEDVDSIAMMKADGMAKCWHTSCNKWFRSMVTVKEHMRMKEHQCKDSETCAGCNQTTDDITLPEIRFNKVALKCLHKDCTRTKMSGSLKHLQLHCKGVHRCTLTFASCPNSNTYRRNKFRADPNDAASIKMILAKGLTKCPHKSCGNFFHTLSSKVRHAAKKHQCAQDCKACLQSMAINSNDDDGLITTDRPLGFTVEQSGNEALFDMIKCPHVSCEHHGSMDDINIHLGQDHNCQSSSQLQQQCIGCQLSRHNDNDEHHQRDWLLV